MTRAQHRASHRVADRALAGTGPGAADQLVILAGDVGQHRGQQHPAVATTAGSPSAQPRPRTHRVQARAQNDSHTRPGSPGPCGVRSQSRSPAQNLPAA